MKTVRCAIYTRKSSEEGLEQAFNSLDAQREACAAYVLSQASEGWSALPDIYDDGGLSGGSLERPALQRLLADVAGGRIDIIVVYKVDRLTRSLLDFAKLVEAFDKTGTSFVSVTQSFNTTTSMGRLTLNMLLSFAQFEREVTAERIRDKIAASKARGMWMGGTPPLGYRPEGRSLAIVEDHAAIVRDVFERYLRIGNVRLVGNQLAREGIGAPRRETAGGRAFGGCAFTRGQLYAILKNPIYVGDIRHQGKLHKGQHPSIIDREIWEVAQAKLADHIRGARRAARVANPSLLAGLIVDEAGEPLVATHACKGRVRYRYYVSRELQHGGSADAVVGMDVPTALRERLLHVGQALEIPPDPEREAAIMRRLKAQGEFEEAARARQPGPSLPETIGGVPFAIRQHQRDALNAWREKGAFVGIFDLATGAGKTITACYATVQMAKNIPGLTVVIAVPYQNLADQWCDILELFGIDPIRCYVSRADWEAKLRDTIHDIEMAAKSFAAIVVVNRTLKSPEFQQAIARIPGDRFLWIGDECHHHASESFAGFLPDSARYRIGLSATPEHYLDADRNARLAAYYGDTVFTYSLRQAIEDGVLTPYDYFPHIVALTDKEAEEFVELSNEIARVFAREASAASKPSQGLTALLMRRARVIASAANKIPALSAALEGGRPHPHTLFYCGDGTVEGDTDPDNIDNAPVIGRQIEVVSQQLDKLGWRISRFTSREPRRERDAILANFRIGLIDAMVAIKCLDEGIDVPACSTAYILASSRDPRQFIQRRGRILRRSPGKEGATIHDFIVVLPAGYQDTAGHARKLIQSELRRVAEFNELARNSAHAYDVLRPVLTAYDLEHML